jgi:hypothetical protein
MNTPISTSKMVRYKTSPANVPWILTQSFWSFFTMVFTRQRRALKKRHGFDQQRVGDNLMFVDLSP